MYVNGKIQTTTTTVSSYVATAVTDAAAKGDIRATNALGKVDSAGSYNISHMLPYVYDAHKLLSNYLKSYTVKEISNHVYPILIIVTKS
jgi:hypothetical protein